jgi:hypothetical protein
MPNTSATGGPLVPTGAQPPYGKDLSQILQNWLVPLIGLPGSHVVVYDQPEPPHIPDAGDAWAAVRVTISQADKFPAVIHATGATPVDQLQRHERIELLASFYDLGLTGLAQAYMATCRDGTAIGQNRDPLRANGMGLVSVGQPVALPALLKGRWNYRVDLPIMLSRQVARTYSILDVATADIELDADTGKGELTRTIHVHP